jgi:hypothetical protein
VINIEGWLKLYRELIKKPIWKLSTPEQKSILVTLLCMVNHEEKEWEWQGKKYVCQPGQVITSLDKIVKEAGKGISIQNVRTSLVRFEKFGFLTNQSTKESRLVTILNWELYQSQDISLTKKLTDGSQRGNKGVTTNKNDKNDKKEIKEYSSEIIRMADRLKFLILQNNPGAKTPTNLAKWQSDFDKMKRLDNRTDEQIYAVMEFSQKDNFWKSNILSAGKLREKFDTLLLQKDRPKPQQKTGPVNKANFDQQKYTDEDFEKLYKV